VTKIGKEAFSGCKNLSSITIKSTKLTSVGSNAFKGINKKAMIKVPKKQLGKYKKLFNSKSGYKKSMTIKK
ncbi:MAG: leucine-rich repeat protein, partial [Lachnospiraceae bacterium]